MRRLFVILVLSLWMQFARANIVVHSCDETYTAEVNPQGTLVIKHGTQVVNSMKIDHDLTGGIFSLDNSLLIVYGLPNRVNPAYPQVTHLSLYDVTDHRRALMKEVYGGGVYSVAFSSDQRLASVENQFGIDVLNLKAKTTQSFDPTYVVGFTTQQCPFKSKK